MVPVLPVLKRGAFFCSSPCLLPTDELLIPVVRECFRVTRSDTFHLECPPSSFPKVSSSW